MKDLTIFIICIVCFFTWIFGIIIIFYSIIKICKICIKTINRMYKDSTIVPTDIDEINFYEEKESEVY